MMCPTFGRQNGLKDEQAGLRRRPMNITDRNKSLGAVYLRYSWEYVIINKSPCYEAGWRTVQEKKLLDRVRSKKLFANCFKRTGRGNSNLAWIHGNIPRCGRRLSGNFSFIYFFLLFLFL